MISVGNSTMTITTLILLLATGILVVTAVDNCFSPQHTLFTNCCDTVSKYFFTFGKNVKISSGIYSIKFFCGNNSVIADAYCNNCVGGGGGGGWLVVQRRQDGSIDFNRTWLEYEDGFGKLTGEFWYGLRALHCLTGQGGWKMRMDIKLANGTNIFLQYEQFKVASANDKYKLTVGGFQGTTTDPMAYHNGMNFTTKDNDNDQWSNNCAIDHYGRNTPAGGWWYKACSYIQANTLYNHSSAIYLNRQWHSLPFIEMKIRPHNCNI